MSDQKIEWCYSIKNSLFPQNELRPYVGSCIKSVRPCTDLISCFADDKT